MKHKEPFYKIVATKIIEALKTHTAPWLKPWEAGGGLLPFNPVSGTRYKGANMLHLMSQGHDDDPRWMTYKQAQQKGWQVREGERSTLIQYWQFREEALVRDEAGVPLRGEDGKSVKRSTPLERPRVFYASLFHASQIEGIPPFERPAPRWDRHDRAEALLNASGASIRFDQTDKAFYSVVSDSIHLPPEAQFPSSDRYYATALHELGHWTGHEKRLGRDIRNPFGSEEYAREELRAEIASLILGEELGIGHNPEQHVAYIESWIRILEKDPAEIVRAARDAEGIASFIKGQEVVRHETLQSALSSVNHSEGSMIPDAPARRAQTHMIDTLQRRVVYLEEEISLRCRGGEIVSSENEVLTRLSSSLGEVYRGFMSEEELQREKESLEARYNTLLEALREEESPAHDRLKDTKKQETIPKRIAWRLSLACTRRLGELFTLVRNTHNVKICSRVPLIGQA